MSDEQMEVKIAEAVARAIEHRPRRINPMAVATLALAIVLPISAWTMNLGNRVSVLESQANALQDAAVQLSALKQELTDFRNEFEEWKRDQAHEPQR